MPKISPKGRITPRGRMGTRGRIPTPPPKGRYKPRGRISQQVGITNSVYYNRAVRNLTQAKIKILKQVLYGIIADINSGKINSMGQIPQQYRGFFSQAKVIFEARRQQAIRVARVNALKEALRKQKRLKELQEKARLAAKRKARNSRARISRNIISYSRKSGMTPQQKRNNDFVKLITRRPKLPWEK